MTFTVGSLLALPDLRTRSLTPGVGEDREIAWAHVCELPNPWLWLGPGALLMTTGINVPTTTDEQCEYLTGLSEAGIAALAVDAEMLKAPLTPPTLAYAAHLGFPVLETANEVPFVTIAMAVANAARQEGTMRVRSTEQLYAALSRHPIEAPIDDLLLDLAGVLGGSLRLEQPHVTFNAAPDQAVPLTPGLIRKTKSGALVVGLAGRGSPGLVWDGRGATDAGLLQHAAGIVGSALAVKLAAHRTEWMHGSLLLSDLCEVSVPSEPAAHLVAAYGVKPPFVLAVAPSADARDVLDASHAEFSSANAPAIATIKDAQVLVLAHAGSECDEALEALAGEHTRIGVSAQFSDLEGLQTALRQARSAMIRNHQSGNVLRFEEHEATSLFLPQGTEQLRSIARQVLGPLTTYDQQRGTSLTHTLQVFLEENRSWVRASERLYVHRQTLIARVSRIEKIIDRDLSSMEDAAECWLAVQAAIGCGDLAPSADVPILGGLADTAV